MKIRKLTSALMAFNAINPKQFAVHHALVFLYIADKGRPTYKEIERDLGMSNAAVSRSLNTMSDNAKHKKNPGYGLVDIDRDEREGRRYRVKLTPKGIDFFNRLTEI